MQFDCQASPMADPSSSSTDNERKTNGSDISGNRRMDRYGTAAVTGWNVRKGKNGKKSQSSVQENLGDVNISFYCAAILCPAMLVMT